MQRFFEKSSHLAAAVILLALSGGLSGCAVSLGPTPAAPHASPDRAYLMTVTSLPPRNSGGLWPFGKDELGPSLADRAESELDLLTERATKLKAAGSQYIEVWIPWSEAEPEPGRFEFGKFERLLSAVVATGQKVEITLASSMYPPWFYDSVLAAVAGRNMLWYWDDGGPSPQAVPETALGAHHQFNPRRVQSPHLSPRAPPDAKTYIRRFVYRALQDLLDKWSPAVLYFHFSLGRLNEPLYPDRLHFWCYDPNVVLDFRARMETRYRTIGALNEAWRTRYADFSEVRPPIPPFEGIHAAQMTDFLAWYRDSKRRWVLEATGWVQAHLQPWQKNLVSVAGGSGDIELALQVREEITESSVEVSWTTDEPTEGFVLCGLSPRRLDRLSSVDGLKTEHRVSLEKPAAGATCYYLVFATDAFGNSSAGPVRFFAVQ